MGLMMEWKISTTNYATLRYHERKAKNINSIDSDSPFNSCYIYCKRANNQKQNDVCLLILQLVLKLRINY